MLVRLSALTLALSSNPIAASADHSTTALPAKPQLTGVTEGEAAALVTQLERSQAALRAGEKPSFYLYAGAPSYYDASKTSPRDAFLALDWKKALWIRTTAKGNYSKAYRLDILPDGYDHLVNEVRIWVNTSGEFERIDITTRPPDPL